MRATFDAEEGVACADSGEEALPAYPFYQCAHVPNVLKSDFCSSAPNQKWETDVTEFNVKGSKLYLYACIDLYSGEIVAYEMAKCPS